MMDFRNKHVHFVGIGGISLSALALFVLERGGVVTGSDLAKSRTTSRLERIGVKVYFSHEEHHVFGADMVVVSGAIDSNNPEVKAAMKNCIPIFTRAMLLAEIASEYKNVITIAGSHGKTTTTGMVASCLLEAGLNPTIHIGGEMVSIGGNVRLGEKSFFVTEACEYKDSFLAFQNQMVSCVLNVQDDHMDYFKTRKNLQNSFQKYLKNTNKNGFLILNGDDEFLENVDFDAKIIRYGIKNKNVNVIAKNIRECRWSKFSFDLFINGERCARIKLPCVGKHQIYNALATVSICLSFGISIDVIVRGLEKFSGIKRRFEDVGEINGAKVFHDYAHHPTEIQANIKAAKKFTKGKLFVVFQPHTFSRTRDLWYDFLKCFEGADEVCIFKIYPARESPIDGISAETLAKEIRDCGVNSTSFENYYDLFQMLMQHVCKYDIVLILGAGDIENFCNYVKEEREI